MSDKSRLTEPAGLDVVDGYYRRHPDAKMRCQLIDRECRLVAETVANLFSALESCASGECEKCNFNKINRLLQLQFLEQANLLSK